MGKVVQVERRVEGYMVEGMLESGKDFEEDYCMEVEEYYQDNEMVEEEFFGIRR